MWWRENYPERLWPVFEDFKVFLGVIWKHQGLPPTTFVQRDIADALQNETHSALIIQAFRGCGKSLITSAFVCWVLLRDPQKKILVASANQDRAESFTTFVLKLFEEVPLLKHLSPEGHSSKTQRYSRKGFDVALTRSDQAHSVKSAGIMGQITGSRADIIIADDVEIPNNSETQGMREKLRQRVGEFTAIIKPGGRILYLGTPQCEESLYNHLSAEKGFTTLIWPAKYPPLSDVITIYRGCLAPSLITKLETEEASPGDPVEPSRFHADDLARREISYGKSGFALQFMLNSTLSDEDRTPLKLSDLIVHGLDLAQAPARLVWSNRPEHVLTEIDSVGLRGDRFYRPAYVHEDYIPYQGCVMFVDPSGRGADETAYAVVKHANGYLFLADAGSFPGGFDDEVLTQLAQIAGLHKTNEVLVESNFGQGAIGHLLKKVLNRIHPCPVIESRSHKQKELRIIETLEPVLNQHRLVVDQRLLKRDRKIGDHDIPLQKQLFYQMSRITRDRGSLVHDDRLDALAGAVKYWTERLSLDADSMIKKRKDERRQMILDAHHKYNLSLDQIRILEKSNYDESVFRRLIVGRAQGVWGASDLVL